MTRILIVQGHPDTEKTHFCHALAQAYADAARGAGHDVTSIDIADISVPYLRSHADWIREDLPEFVHAGQRAIQAADHVVFIYPLWLGTMPALLKSWLEQVLRERFAFHVSAKGWRARLKGKSARVIVTMGMPSLFYRVFYRAHSLRSFERNILRFCGLKPVRSSIFGQVEGGDGTRREAYLAETARNGAAAR